MPHDPRARRDRRKTASDRRHAPRPASTGTAAGTAPKEPRRAESSAVCTRSTLSHPPTDNRPARPYAHAGDASARNPTCVAGAAPVVVGELEEGGVLAV